MLQSSDRSTDINYRLSAIISLLDNVIDDQKYLNDKDVMLVKDSEKYKRLPIDNDNSQIIQKSGVTKAKKYQFLPKHPHSLEHLYHMNFDD